MPLRPLAGLAGKRAGALCGWALAMIGTLLSLPTLLSLHGRAGTLAGVVFAVGGLAATLLLAVPWERLPRLALLVWPLGLMTTLTVAALACPPGALATLSGLIVVAFLYVGVFERQGTGLALVPAAMVTILVAYGGWTHELVLRLPITVGIWIVVSESLSNLRARLQRATDTLHAQATTDPLTGLSTRQVLTGGLGRVAAGDAIVFVDLDHFKAVNDTRGHFAGDAVLADFGGVVREMIREGDLAVRFGGEEVVLVLARAGVAGAQATLARTREAWRMTQPGVTFSAGIAVVGADADTTAAMAAADAALYRAKEAGRDRWEVAAPAAAGGAADPGSVVGAVGTGGVAASAAAAAAVLAPSERPAP